MDISDFLKQDQFQPLDDYLTQTMYSVAGKELVKKMTEVFNDENNARNWFYTKIGVLRNKRPYDCCMHGQKDNVELILEQIENGVLS
ncbi:MAG: hypothetical protein ABIC91_07940 [Nanoarchaeota archaeon]|nr:MbcA/ParS/Xre antitoxin family protein [Nanoarchaeota archaeon]MBU1030636.1 MbcA/ParS/Xre antitoxin family protein [Nanoarchaeota archaeon]MBU1849362.1 MbcA/ParS/Xre antitoxin family protein [Nanoarchaeota archaeon]